MGARGPVALRRPASRERSASDDNHARQALSDGDALGDGIAELCQSIGDAHVTIDVIGIADVLGLPQHNVLAIIAGNTNGRLVVIHDAGDLPANFISAEAR